MAGSMATTSNAAMRKKTPFYVSIFKIHDTSVVNRAFYPTSATALICAHTV
jgi:hypothetical protein